MISPCIGVWRTALERFQVPVSQIKQLHRDACQQESEFIQDSLSRKEAGWSRFSSSKCSAVHTKRLLCHTVSTLWLICIAFWLVFITWISLHKLCLLSVVLHTATFMAHLISVLIQHPGVGMLVLWWSTGHLQILRSAQCLHQCHQQIFVGLLWRFSLDQLGFSKASL